MRVGSEVKSERPSVDEARPSCCVACRAAAYDGRRIVLHGHGVRERQQRGPPGASDPPECGASWARRYLCTACKATMTVLAATARSLKHFSGVAIALALALWGQCDLSARQVRKRVNDWKPGPSARGWLSLRRWALEAAGGRLFLRLGLSPGAGTPREQAGRAAQALIGWASLEAREQAPEAAAFDGALHVS